jgi:hypothetical protein
LAVKDPVVAGTRAVPVEAAVAAAVVVAVAAVAAVVEALAAAGSVWFPVTRIASIETGMKTPNL